MTRIDPSKSIYHEAPGARNEYNKAEIRHLRTLLRRLRFLEAQIRERGGIADGASGGGAFAEYEVAALEFVLDELGFLAPRRRDRQ